MPSLSEIALLAGQQRAESLRRQADIETQRRAASSQLWGGLGMNLAQLGANAFGQYRQEKTAAAAAKLQQANFEKQFGVQQQQAQQQQDQWTANAPQRAATLTATTIANTKAQAEVDEPKFIGSGYDAAKETGPDGIVRIDPAKLQAALIAQGHSELVSKALDGLNKWNATADQVDVLKREMLAHGAISVETSQYNPIVIESYIRNAVDRQIMTPQDAGHFLQAPKAEQQKIIRSILANSKQYGAQYSPVAVGGGNVYTPGTGEFQAPPPVLKPSDFPDPGSFADYMSAPPERRRQIEQARRAYTEAGRDPTPGPQTATGLPPRTETQVQSIARNFGTEPIVRRASTMGEAMTFLNNMPANTKNPADHQGLIYAFAKVMDPESVVREGEYATVQKYAQSWLATFGFDARRVVDGGGFLTDKAMSNMRATISQRFEAARSGYDNLVKSYTSRINHLTGKDDGGVYLTDYAGAFPDPPRPPGVSPTAKFNRATGTWKEPPPQPPGGGH